MEAARAVTHRDDVALSLSRKIHPLPPPKNRQFRNYERCARGGNARLQTHVFSGDDARERIRAVGAHHVVDDEHARVLVVAHALKHGGENGEKQH